MKAHMNDRAYRILDANFNRAREGLRVMEDYARFALNDSPTCASIKSIRHRLSAIFRAPPLAAAILFRDTPGDVGTQVQTESEYARADLSDVALAAGKRVSEALRTLEEVAKTVAPSAAKAFEQLRYAGYDVEKRLIHITRAKKRWNDVRTCVLLTESLCKASWRDTLEQVIEGGADCVQLREKDMTDRELMERASTFCDLCQKAGVISIINDRADIAAVCRADGVHLGQDDLTVSAARRIVGPQAIVGVSTHSVEEARRANEQCPDYVAAGPMFATSVKPEYGVNGPQFLAKVRQETALPLVGIGGITADNVRQVIDAGADCVAVCTSVIGADDPARALRRIWEAAGF